jgi:ATP-dependent DNA helicase RecQ
VELRARDVPAIDADTWSQALAVRAKHPDALADSRAFARFVGGIGSPKASRARLTRHPLFGALSRVPFAALLEAAERPL